jgi:hypothetical protein
LHFHAEDFFHFVRPWKIVAEFLCLTMGCLNTLQKLGQDLQMHIIECKQTVFKILQLGSGSGSLPLPFLVACLKVYD